MGGAPAGRRGSSAVTASGAPEGHAGRRRRAAPLAVFLRAETALAPLLSRHVSCRRRPLTKPCNCKCARNSGSNEKFSEGSLSASSMQLVLGGPKRRARRGRQRGTPALGLAFGNERRDARCTAQVSRLAAQHQQHEPNCGTRRAPPAPGGQTNKQVGGARAARPSPRRVRCVLGFQPPAIAPCVWPERARTRHARLARRSPQPWPLQN